MALQTAMTLVLKKKKGQTQYISLINRKSSVLKLEKSAIFGELIASMATKINWLAL